MFQFRPWRKGFKSDFKKIQKEQLYWAGFTVWQAVTNVHILRYIYVIYIIYSWLFFTCFLPNCDANIFSERSVDRLFTFQKRVTNGRLLVNVVAKDCRTATNYDFCWSYFPSSNLSKVISKKVAKQTTKEFATATVVDLWTCRWKAKGTNIFRIFSPSTSSSDCFPALKLVSRFPFGVSEDKWDLIVFIVYICFLSDSTDKGWAR